MIETYKLKAPITVSGNKIEKVDLREPTFNEISAMGLPGDASTPDEKLSLLRKYVVTCSGLSDEAVGQLGIRDAMALIRKVLPIRSRAEENGCEGLLQHGSILE